MTFVRSSDFARRRRPTAAAEDGVVTSRSCPQSSSSNATIAVRIGIDYNTSVATTGTTYPCCRASLDVCKSLSSGSGWHTTKNPWIWITTGTDTSTSTIPSPRHRPVAVRLQLREQEEGRADSNTTTVTIDPLTAINLGIVQPFPHCPTHTATVTNGAIESFDQTEDVAVAHKVELCVRGRQERSSLTPPLPPPGSRLQPGTLIAVRGTTTTTSQQHACYYEVLRVNYREDWKQQDVDATTTEDDDERTRRSTPAADHHYSHDCHYSQHDPNTNAHYYSNSKALYTTDAETHYRVVTAPPWVTTCPPLPPIGNDTAKFPHPNVDQLLQNLYVVEHTASTSSELRVWHVIGTQHEHHLEDLVKNVASALGRSFLSISGLASYAYFKSKEEKGSNNVPRQQQQQHTPTGSIVDQLSGLEAALDQAIQQAPSVLLLQDCDGEVSNRYDGPLRQSHEGRLWSLIVDKLGGGGHQQQQQQQQRITAESSSSPPLFLLPQVPSVLVLLATKGQLLPGPWLEGLVHDSIHLSLPDSAYAEFLWENDKDGISMSPSWTFLTPQLLTDLMKGRPAHEILEIRQDFILQASSLPNPTAEHLGEILEGLCQKRDEERRRKSGLGRVPQVHWEDVGGLANVRREIMDAIELPLSHPHLFADSSSRGILLYGPPGTGKTLVAKAVATECGLPFVSVKGPELLGSYVGESEAHVRGVFEQAHRFAEQNQPQACILFFDELDSLAPRRGDQASGGNVMDRVVATLFAELDKTSLVFCIGATNRPDLLDPALLRPGRFDRLVYLGVSGSDQTSILLAQLRKLRLDGDARTIVDSLVPHLPANLTGADLSTIVSDGLLQATERLCKEADQELLQLQAEGNHSMTVDDVLARWDESRLEPVVTFDDLVAASKSIIPSVSPAELAKYQALGDKYWTSEK